MLGLEIATRKPDGGKDELNREKEKGKPEKATQLIARTVKAAFYSYKLMIHGMKKKLAIITCLLRQSNRHLLGSRRERSIIWPRKNNITVEGKPPGKHYGSIPFSL